jgi:hypothetical protein
MRIALLVALSLSVASAVAADPWKDMAKQIFQQQAGPAGVALTDSDIVKGLREALAKGTRNAVLQLGKTDGFWADTRFRIPLPGPMMKADTFLRAAGYGPSLDELHLSFNRAAERAVPIAADVFAVAVEKLTVNDARSILNGPNDAATQYFKRTTGHQLALQFKPIVAGVTARVGLVQQYQKVIAPAGAAAGLLGPTMDVNDYVTDRALNSLFLRVADEEEAIRRNPAARTSEVLKRVFGSR